MQLVWQINTPLSKLTLLIFQRDLNATPTSLIACYFKA